MRFKPSAVFSAIAGALSLSAPGRKFLEVVFWDRVMHAMTSDPVLLFGKDYGPAIGFLALALYLASSPSDRARWMVWAREKMNWWLLFASAGAFALLIGLAGYYLDWAKGPIIWNFEEGMLAAHTRGSGPPYVNSFQIFGRNR
jgi:hypothetical protein